VDNRCPSSMREIRVCWKKASLLYTELGMMIYDHCESFEVVAHLKNTPEGLSVIANIHFKEGKCPENFVGNPYFTFERHRGTLDEDKYVVILSHPLVLGVLEGEIAVYPPYGFDENGLTLLLRGTVEGVRGFLAGVRLSFRDPDTLSTMTNGVLDTKEVLTDRQLDIVRSAVMHGYYSKPREINLRQLADVLDMARSTLGEHLHRAESTMMKWAASDDF